METWSLNSNVLDEKKVYNFPASFAQKRMWFLDKLSSSGSSFYNIHIVWELKGSLNKEFLQRSLDTIVGRHEILRTVFSEEDGELIQLIYPFKKMKIEEINLIDLPQEKHEEKIQSLIEKEITRPFDLFKGPLFRVTLLQLSFNHHILIMVKHHIISDGWSIDIFLNELIYAYEKYTSNEQPELEELPIQYVDYSEWQRGMIENGKLQEQLEYWKRKLKDAPPIVDIPMDHSRPLQPTFRGELKTFTIPHELNNSLKKLCLQEGVTPFMVLLSVFNVLLHRYSQQEDISIGTPIANRYKEELSNMVGLLTNTLVIRSYVDPNHTFRNLLHQVCDTTLEAYDYQDLPFEKLVEELSPKRDLSYSPMFQIMFVYHDKSLTQPVMSDLSISQRGYHTKTSKFDITLTIEVSEEGLNGSFEFNTDLFELRTIEQMLVSYQTLLEQILANPYQEITVYNLLPKSQKLQLVSNQEQDSEPPLVRKCLYELFEAQADRFPDHVALSMGNRNLTYRNVDQLANQLANYLTKIGVGPNMLVGICVEPSFEMIVAILGILKSGGAYVPMVPTYPDERFNFIVNDSNVRIILSQERFYDKLTNFEGEIINLDLESEMFKQEPKDRLSIKSIPDSLAYVIYTSGSTGKPKGVLVNNWNVVRLLRNTENLFEFNQHDVWTLFHSYAFDFSVWEIWGALAYGGRLVIVPEEYRAFPEYFYDLISREQVTVLNQTPSAFRQLMHVGRIKDDVKLSLRYVIFGGEAFDASIVNLDWLEKFEDKQPQLVNMYGITETTVHTTYKLVTKDFLENKKSLIGKPLPDLQIHLLDKWMKPVPEGVPGEMYISGDGVACGYLNRPKLTKERFISLNVEGEGIKKFYKTGDLAKYLPSGELEYLGRIDHQVKIRGFRIELGEIEFIISSHPKVRECVVIAKEYDEGQFLQGYVVLEQIDSIDAEDLKSFLKQQLPDFMIPVTLIFIEAIPLTPNGKIDRQALLEIEVSDVHNESRGYVPPRTGLEKHLAKLWESVLNLERVGIDDNFFGIGGDSIRSIQLISRAHLEGITFSTPQLFQYQTIREMALMLNQLNKEEIVGDGDETSRFSLVSESDLALLPPDAEDAYPLTEMQKGMVFHSEYHDIPAYINIRSLYVKGIFNKEAFSKAVETITLNHDVLRTSIHLNGFSKPLQIVHRNVEIPLDVTSIESMTREEQDKWLKGWLKENRRSTFNLEIPPLFKLHVHIRSRETFQLTMIEHHAILDGWSVASMITELFQVYSEIINGSDKIIKRNVNVSFRDYVAMEKRSIDSPSSRQFWQEQLENNNLIKIPEWSFSKTVESVTPEIISHSIGGELLKNLRKVALSSSVPLKSLFLAGYLRVLSFITGETDVTTGLVMSGRPERNNGDQLLGVFLNTVPFRKKLRGNSWIGFIKEVFELEKKISLHRMYPLNQLLKDSGTRSLFDSIFNYTQFHVYNNFNEEFEVLAEQEYAHTNFVFTCDVNVVQDYSDAQLIFEWDMQKISKEQVMAILNFYMKALREIATCSEQNFLNSSLLSNEEYYQLKEEWNSTSREYPAELSVQEVFENVVQRYPDAVAVSSGGDSLSYKELNERANQLANALKARGVTSNVLIGVCIEKSIEIAVAILGIIKAGGAYVPLDPNYPKVRIQEIIDDSKLSLIVTGSSEQIKNEVLFNGIEQISVYDQQVRKQATSNLIFKSRPNDALYVIYTSGSTGKPKGVVIEHQSLVNHCYLMAEDFGLNITDNLLQFASISFDVAVEEMFLAWFSGANLVIPQQDLPTFQIFNEFLEQEKITVMDLPTAFWHNWVSDSLDQQKMLPKNLRIIIIGGEKVTPDKMMDWNNCQKNPIRLLNCYGPTEATITTTYCDLSEWDNEFIIPIGKPISNYQVYVLNSFKELVPTGTPGELYIGGVGLAREYYGQPELTAKFFIPNIFSEGQGRLYRTGDIVRTLPDGNIEYLYRSDQQVKVRGYRIELGEIEAELLKHPSIREVVVLAIEESRTNTELCVYFSSDKNISSLDLRNYLKKSLPSYMIPGIFINMEKFKLTINGKIDRKALPAPGNSANTGGAYLAPQTEIEHKLVPLWEEVLNVNKIGIVDDFFTLGGHSLNAMSLVAKIRKKLQLDVSIKDIFKNSSIKELALSLEGMKEKKLESVQVIGEQDYYPSSSAQKSVFFLHEMERGGTTYNIPHIYKVKGKLDREKAECCLQKLVQRHEALRTSFQMIDGEPFQFVQKGLKVECEIMEINESFTYECVNRIVEEFIRRFELSKAPLIRMATLSLNKEEHILMFDMHHIISDGISIELFMSEFVSLYEGKSLEELRLQYKDYSTMQNNWFHSNDMKGQSSFWMKQLEGELPILDLPLDYTRPLIQSFKGSVFTFDWNETLTIKLKELAKNTNTTLYMVLLAIYQILLSKYSGQEDILVGTPVSGRSHVDFDNIIGMFVNTMVMRNRPSQDKTFLGFLGEVRDNVLGVYGNMDFPFEVLVEQLKIERDASRNIVFDTMFAFQNKADSPWMNLIEENLSFEPYEIDHKTSKFDLTLQVIENNDTLSLSFEYNTDLFKKETIESMALHIKKLTQSILAHPDSLIRQINMTTNQDQLQLEKFNNTKVILQDKTIIDLFEEQVERTPNQIAVIVGERSITYKELNKKANQLASTLMNNGVRLNDYVGLLIENSIEMAIGILGTLKAGGAYVPIDPDYPQERIDFMIKNGNLTLLLKQSYLDTPLCMKCAILNIDEDMNYQGDGSNLNLFIPKDAVAYIIYTSGTTGRPKGVVIEHDGIYNTVQFRVNNFKMNSSHKALQLYFFAFDGFIVGFFTPLASGSTVVLLPQEEKMNLLAIKKCITNLKITHITCVPSLYLALLEHLQSNEVKNLQMVLMGGEKILPDLVKKSKILDGNIELVNEYGPSENSVSTTICRELQKAEKITIGCPINNTQIFILNSNYQVQPIGVPGELCITGKGLAKGYLNQPDLTAEKFIHHPTVSKKRLYRTGDLARWLSDGTIEYLGRLDEQVKIRGYRIELGEIESRILEYDAVKECTIVEQKTEDNQAYLCAYIVFNQNEQKPDLRNALKKVLPYYMVPTHFIGVEKIPLSANGKINKKALPIPIQLPSIKNYEPPQSLLENDLTILWEEVLKIKNIGINDDFFELGGNSLKALSFLSKMKETKNIEMRFSTFIKNTTIKNLAEFIEEEINRISTSQSDLFLTLFNHSGNPNVFCFPPIGGSSAVFTPLSEYLTDYSVYGFDFIPDTDRLHKYVDAILEVQPEGEVKLLGYSAGGNLVFEVAKVLIQRGCLVSDLIFLDSYPKSELGHNQKGNLSVLLENLTDSDGNRIQNELTQESIRMIEKYLHYFNKLVNKGIVYSNIHLIKAEDNHPLPSNQIGTWREATTRKYVEYRGRGSHFKMLDADYLKHNIALVREILDS